MDFDVWNTENIIEISEKKKKIFLLILDLTKYCSLYFIKRVTPFAAHFEEAICIVQYLYCNSNQENHSQKWYHGEKSFTRVMFECEILNWLRKMDNFVPLNLPTNKIHQNND